ncbi:uncharacterized protein BDR25DRAFT_213265, partial [Lindgomyces ingoldianus]
SKVLAAQCFPPDVRKTYAALSDWGDGRPLIEEKAHKQQYITKEEEKALVTFLLLMSDLAQSVRIKYIPSLAFSITRWRSSATTDTDTDNAIKSPGKNWARSFEKRHQELKARRVRAIDWKRHGHNTYPKIV